MKKIINWFCCNIFFISWGKYFKGIYIHFLPTYSYRIYYMNGNFGINSSRRPKLGKL